MQSTYLASKVNWLPYFLHRLSAEAIDDQPFDVAGWNSPQHHQQTLTSVGGR